MSEKDTRQNMKVVMEDYRKIQDFMAENNFSSNTEFMHFVAENLSAVRKITTPDGDEADGNDKTILFAEVEDDAPDDATKNASADGEADHATKNAPADRNVEGAATEAIPSRGDEGSAETLLSAAAAKNNTKDGILVNGKFYPVIFPNESWEAEDRYYYFHWVGDNINRLLRFDLQKAFDDMRTWATDHDGQPKEKTPYGYFTKKYLTWHTWPVYPELWPNLPRQRVIFPECQEDDYQEALRRRHHDPFAGTNLRHRDKHFI